MNRARLRANLAAGYDPAAGSRLLRSRYAFRRLVIAGARLEHVPVNTGTMHGPYRKCAVHDCPEPALHFAGEWCADHTFTRLPGPRWPASKEHRHAS